MIFINYLIFYNKYLKLKIILLNNMYILYSVCIGLTSIILYKYISSIFKRRIRGNKRNIKKFDYVNDNYFFYLTNIEFYRKKTLIKTIDYNKEIKIQKNFELNIDEIFDYMIISYKYNNISYKFYSNNSFLTFPLYLKSEIKNYAYINKLSEAILEINTEIEKKNINILSLILPFLGPNYNFYEDLNIKIILNDIINYFLLKEKTKVNIDINNYTLKLYDSFHNEYILKNDDYLKWMPKLNL